MADGILSVGDGGREVATYDTATDGPMSLVGEGASGDALVIQSGDQVRPQTPGGGGSVGDVSREGVTVDNRIARWHGAGSEVQSSVVSINDDGDISGYGTLTGGTLGTQLVDTDGLLRILAIGQNGATDRQAMLWDDGGGNWVVDDILEPGAGTLNRIPLWTPDANHLGNSDLEDDGNDLTVLSNDFIVAQGDGTFTLGDFRVLAGESGFGRAPVAGVRVVIQENNTQTSDMLRILQLSSGDAAIGFVAVGGTGTDWILGTDGTDGSFGLGLGVGGVDDFPAFIVDASRNMEIVVGDFDVSLGDVRLGIGDVLVESGIVKIGNQTTVTPNLVADDLVVDRNALQAGMTLVSTTTAHWVAADAGSDSAGSLVFDHITDTWLVKIGATVETTFSDGVVTIDAKGKSGRSDIGGNLIMLTNDTGLDTVKGQLVDTSATTPEAFDTAGSNSANVIGIVLEAGIADGEEAWIVEGGIAEVLVDTGGAALRDRLITSGTAGRATVSNSPSNTDHFREIGHVLEAVGGLALAKTALHFN